VYTIRNSAIQGEKAASYQDILICVVYIALILETVTTVWTFVMLYRAGIKIHHKHLSICDFTIFASIFESVALMLMLAAALS